MSYGTNDPMSIAKAAAEDELASATVLVSIPSNASIGDLFRADMAHAAPVFERVAPVSAAQLAAEFLESADRTLDIAIRNSVIGPSEVDDVRKVLHSLVRNLAQGLAGRVLP